MKKALAIGGSDSIAGAGIQADLKTFAALGVYGASVITSITAQNTKGIQGIIDLHSRFVALQIDAVFSDIEVDSTKIGMLLNNEIINTVASKLKKYNVKKIVLDPVMYSHGDTPLLNPASKNHLIKKIFPHILVTSYKPLKVWVYSKGFARFCNEQYTTDIAEMDNMFIHLTNVAI